MTKYYDSNWTLTENGGTKMTKEEAMNEAERNTLREVMKMKQREQAMYSQQLYDAERCGRKEDEHKDMTTEEALAYEKEMKTKLMLQKTLSLAVQMECINIEMYKLARLRDNFSGKMLEDLRVMSAEALDETKKAVNEIEKVALLTKVL